MRSRASGLSQIAEEGADMVGEQLWLLESGEMSSPIRDIGPSGNVVGLFGEATDTNVVSEHDGAGRHARGLSGWPPRGLGITDIRRRPSGGGEPIDHDVGQQPIAIDDRVRHAVQRVCPGAEFVHYPGELADRRVDQRCAYGLRSRGLNRDVTELVLHKLLDSFRPVAFKVGHRREFVLAELAGRHADTAVDVYSDDPLRCCAPDRGRHAGTDIAPMNAKPVVAQPSHQLEPGSRNPVDIPTRVGYRARETEAGQAGNDEVKRVRWVATAASRVSQWPKHVEELHKRARPPMGE